MRAEALGRLLRAVFCYREDVPLLGNREAFATLALPESLLGDDAVLAGSFQGDYSLRKRYPELARHPKAFRIAAIEDPLIAQARVYRHLLETQPDLPARKPARFSTLGHFLRSRTNSISQALAEALGRRRVSVKDFDAVAGDDPEGLAHLAARLSEWTTDRRAKRLLQALVEAPEKCAREFPAAPAEAIQIDEGTLRIFRRQNRADYELFEASRERAHRRRRQWPILRKIATSSTPAAADEPAFVFNHLPKSYGSSLRVLLAGGFSMVEDHTRFLDVEGVIRDTPVDTSRLTADTIFAGHLCHGDFLLQRRYPEIWANPRFKIFTYLRNPLDTAISNFLHVTERYPEVVAADPELYASVDEYVRRMNNPIAERLGCTRENMDAVLGRYFFIGVAEKHHESLPRLLDAMERQLAQAPDSITVRRARAVLPQLRSRTLPHENPRRSGDSLRECLSAETLEIFQSRNALDLEIYRHADMATVEP